jgi:pyrroloquinoline quinone biosynthesis protein D
MSTNRGRRRSVEGKKNKEPHVSRRLLQLARGVRLGEGTEQSTKFVLICAEGKVQLNGSAVAILQLCDGSRNRDDIVAELMLNSDRHAFATEIVEFLDAARGRGWIVETKVR